MKKKLFSFISLTLVIIILISATGCGVRINGKDYVIFKASEKEHKNNIFSGIVNGMGSESSDAQTVTEERQDGEVLSINDGTGNIEFKKSNDQQIVIEAHKRVKGSSDEEKQNILDNLNIYLERDGKNIKVAAQTKDGEDFWKWQSNNYKAYNVSINFEISVPEGIKEIDANTGAGNIDIEGVASQMNLNTGAGNIDINDASALGDTELDTGAGNIDFDGNINEVSSFKASTGVGNVDFSVPDDTKMYIDAGTGLGHLSGYFIKSERGSKTHFQGDINGGGPEVKLNTGVGNIDADNS